MIYTGKMPEYYLGANTANGFVSRFADNYDNYDGWKTYIIKGGPGTGKSTLMKKAAEALKEKNYDVAVCPCSADPGSLDAVIAADKKLMILDGTAPHVVEPQYPGVCEEIVNLGEAFIISKFNGKREMMIELNDRIKTLHTFAARYISAAGKLLGNSYYTARSAVNIEKTEAYADSLAMKILVKKQQPVPVEWKRYLCSPSCGGVASLSPTVNTICKSKVVLCDEDFAVSSVFMDRIKRKALSAGYEIINCINPFISGEISDHIIIPELSIAFCTQSRFCAFEGDERHINSGRFADMSILRQNKNKLAFNKKTADMLLNEAGILIKKAKLVHDELENCYISAMDYEKLNEISDCFLEKIK